MRILVVNSGSSSLKLRVVDDDDAVVGSADLGPDAVSDDTELSAALSALPAPDAVGHRVVHGGTRFTDAAVVDDAVESGIADLTHLAPLHQPRGSAAIAALRKALPDVPHVACFDTAFHRTLPAASSTYAIPREWREELGVRKYGFHGLSHAYVARRVAELAPESRRVVSCHLGAGASATAILDGSSVDTTMGFTPLDGLVMATRSGTIDPGAVLWLQQQSGLSLSDVEDVLLHRSGVLGLAGSADMREVVSRDAAGHADAQLALDVYCHRLRGAVAALASAMGGIDTLVFTGGVGENSPAVRAQASGGLGFLGVELDQARNEAAKPDAEIGVDAPVRTFVIAAREELQIASDVRRVLGW